MRYWIPRGKSFRVLAILALLFIGTPADAARAALPPITLSLDASEAPRKILHSHLVIPVGTPGPLTLVYPKWLPGEHGPTGPITDLAGLRLTAAGTCCVFGFPCRATGRYRIASCNAMEA